jgi:hypothetical protein
MNKGSNSGTQLEMYMVSYENENPTYEKHHHPLDTPGSFTLLFC